MNTSNSLMIAVFLLAQTVTVSAQTSEAGFSLGDLERIQEQTLISQARLEQVRADKELQTLTTQPSQSSSSSLVEDKLTPVNRAPEMAQPMMLPPVEGHSPDATTLPNIVQIWGHSHHLHARLKLASGETVIAETHILLSADGLRVVEITPHGVSVANEQGREFALAFDGGTDD